MKRPLKLFFVIFGNHREDLIAEVLRIGMLQLKLLFEICQLCGQLIIIARHLGIVIEILPHRRQKCSPVRSDIGRAIFPWIPVMVLVDCGFVQAMPFENRCAKSCTVIFCNPVILGISAVHDDLDGDGSAVAGAVVSIGSVPTDLAFVKVYWYSR